MATDNITLVKRFAEEVWNKGNMNVADELSSSASLYHDPISKDLSSLDGFKKHVQALRSAFPDFHVAIEDISASGDKVYLRWTATGTNKGAFMGAPATNRSGQLPGMSCHRIQGGKIVETWMSYDVLQLLQQLGLAPQLEKLAKQAAPTAGVQH